MPVDTSYPTHLPLESFPIVALWEASKKTFKGHTERLLRGHMHLRGYLAAFAVPFFNLGSKWATPCVHIL